MYDDSALWKQTENTFFTIQNLQFVSFFLPQSLLLLQWHRYVIFEWFSWAGTFVKKRDCVRIGSCFCRQCSCAVLPFGLMCFCNKAYTKVILIKSCGGLFLLSVGQFRVYEFFVLLITILSSIQFGSNNKGGKMDALNIQFCLINFHFLKIKILCHCHSDLDSKNCSKNQILYENISWASIYPSKVIEVHFCVENSYFLFSSNQQVLNCFTL